MKKVILALLAMIILSACSSENTPFNSADKSENEQAQNITTLYESVWPVNTYTDGLPIPMGTVSWAALDTTHGNCSINLVDVSETDYTDYMERLKQEGFSVIEEISEEIKGQNYISIGTLLSNGEKGLSISYAHNNFVMYISFI